MALTERQRRLTAEHLKATGTAAPEKKSGAGRPAGPPPPPEPKLPPLPPAPPVLPDDDEPSDQWAIAFDRPYTKGQLRGVAWLAEVDALYIAHANAHWAWKQLMGLTSKRK